VTIYILDAINVQEAEGGEKMLRAKVSGLVGRKFAGAKLTGVSYRLHGKGQAVLSLDLAVRPYVQKSGRVLSVEQIREKQSLATQEIRDELLALGVKVKFIRGEAPEIVLDEALPTPKPVDVGFLGLLSLENVARQEGSVSARLFEDEARKFG
jgi:hypothetical protein